MLTVLSNILQKSSTNPRIPYNLCRNGLYYIGGITASDKIKKSKSKFSKTQECWEIYVHYYSYKFRKKLVD